MVSIPSLLAWWLPFLNIENTKREFAPELNAIDSNFFAFYCITFSSSTEYTKVQLLNVFSCSA